MKTIHKVFLVAIIAVVSFGYASADFRFGVKAGVNFSKLSVKNLESAYSAVQDSQTGWEAGVMAEFTIPIVNLGADVSLLYSRQNLNETSEELVYSNKDFLDIPVNLKWKIGLPVVGKIITPMIFTGPDFLIALNKNTIKDVESKTCEVGWNFGLGVELFSHLQITGSYCLGINSIAEKTIGTNSVDYKAKKNYWALSAAYLF